MIICGNAAFIHIPKTAGTSIRHAIASANFGKCLYVGRIVNPEEDMRSELNRYNAHILPQLVTPFLSPDLNLVTCIRNPFDRLCSWYAFRRDQRPFPEFVKWFYGRPELGSLRNPNLPRNPVTQTAYLKGITYTHFLRFETLATDWKIVADLFGAKGIALPRLNQSQRKHYREYEWTPETISLVQSNEELVFERFGYKW